MIVEESEEETKSDFYDSSDSDFESIFVSMSVEDKHEFEGGDGDFDIRRSVAETRDKVKGKVVVSPKKRRPNGVISRNQCPQAPVSGKGLRILAPRDQVPILCLLEHLEPLDFPPRELIPQEKPLLQKERCNTP